MSKVARTLVKPRDEGMYMDGVRHDTENNVLVISPDSLIEGADITPGTIIMGCDRWTKVYGQKQDRRITNMSEELIEGIGEQVVLKDMHIDGGNRTIIMGPNSMMHSVRIAPDVLILNAAFDEELAKEHRGLFPRETDEEYMAFLDRHNEHLVEAQKVVEAIRVLREAPSSVIYGLLTLNVGRKADGKGD